MKFHFRSHGPTLADELDTYRAKPFSPLPRHAGEDSVMEQPVARDACDLREANLDFLFHYRVFPRRILQHYGEWERENRAMRAGDTIVLQSQVPPGWGIHLVFGVRVVAVFQESARAGFKYRTLCGHPETGENEFAFTTARDGVVARIRTVASFSLWISRLFAPVFGRPYVRYCNRAALAEMRASFLQANR